MWSKKDSLFSKAMELANGFLGTFNRIFDRHSPSRAFRKMFRQNLEGAELGTDDEKGNLFKKSDEVAETYTKRMKHGLDKGNLVAKMRAGVDHGKSLVAQTLTAKVLHDVDVSSGDKNRKHDLYKYVREETRLEYEGQRYIVKGINERTKAIVATINAELDLTGLSSKVYQEKTFPTQSFHNLCSEILYETGWTIVDDDLVRRRTTTEATDKTPRQILEHCTNSTSYGTCYEFDSIRKVIRCINPYNNTESRGTYFTDELNLQEVTFKGSSSGLVTRLYPIL